MLKKVFGSVGLAWVDPDERIEITPAGSEFLSSEDPAHVLSTQLSRFQFWNPSVASKVHREIRLHPIPFLGELLRNIDGQQISATEYTLFVSRAKAFNEIDAVLERIEAFRDLDRGLQELLVAKCQAYMIGGAGRRTSIYNTIRLNRSYALRMWALSLLIEVDDDGGLALRKGGLKASRKYLSVYGREGAYIDFANEKDWIAYFGDPTKMPNLETALDYYVTKGDVAAAIATKKEQVKSPGELAAFKDMIISEKAVEDYLENNLDVIGQQINADLELVERQYSTLVGPIDLLARDTKTGEYIVIELKKGRSADKVYGQCSRYMGWIRKNMADGDKVHGVIVAREIDDKLKSARDAHDTKVHLIEFEMKVGAKIV